MLRTMIKAQCLAADARDMLRNREGATAIEYGLIAALVSNGGGLDAFLQRKGESVERTRELPELPEGVGGGGGGYAPVGRVYEDPETGETAIWGSR